MRIVITEFNQPGRRRAGSGRAAEDADGGFAHGGWSPSAYFDEEVLGGAFDAGEARGRGAAVRRRTWQKMAGAWPERAGDPFADDERPQEVRRLQHRWRGRPHLNNTSLIPATRPSPASGNCARPGGDLAIIGRPTLVRTLLSEGLVDELRIVMPVLLGGGKTMFPTTVAHADGAGLDDHRQDQRAGSLVYPATEGWSGGPGRLG
ncbi:hypothetical protein SVIOM74S_07943 [Streptomyces violarus]